MTKENMKFMLYCGIFLLCAASPALAQKSGWRQATSAELTSVLPARAPVENEHIETEMRTASGIVDEHKHFIAGVVLITAGYSADGKYSHYLLVQAPVEIGGVALKPGEYALGWNREVSGQALSVHINLAATGALVGTAEAHWIPGSTRVESLRIWPPSEKAVIQIGRFGISYKLGDCNSEPSSGLRDHSWCEGGESENSCHNLQRATADSSLTTPELKDVRGSRSLRMTVPVWCELLTRETGESILSTFRSIPHFLCPVYLLPCLRKFARQPCLECWRQGFQPPFPRRSLTLFPRHNLRISPPLALRRPMRAACSADHRKQPSSTRSIGPSPPAALWRAGRRSLRTSQRRPA